MSDWLPKSSSTSAPRKPIEGMRFPLLIAGVVCLAVCFIVGMIPAQRPAFFQAYLFGWLFWFAISMGGMALAALHYQTGGNWGRLGRSIAESQALLIPLNAVLFVPLLLGLKYLYPWAQDSWRKDVVLIHRHAYMNGSMFTLRFIAYFAVWIIISLLGVTTAAKYDRNKSLVTYDRLTKIGAAFLVFYVALLTFAGVDWIMSREPHWTSTIFGFIYVIDQCLTALLFLVIVLWQIKDREPLKSFAKPEYFNDLGNLMLTLVILWTYMNFAQYLITWTGNEQEDVGYYIQRRSNGYFAIAGFLIFLHFMVPFILLLFRNIKRDISKLGKLAAFLMIMRVLDLYWMVTPTGDNMKPTFLEKFSILQVLSWVGVGGIYLFFFLGLLQRRPLLPEPFPEEVDATKVSHGH